MRKWKPLAALHATAPSCFLHPPSPSPCPSPPREMEEDDYGSSLVVKHSPSPSPPPRQEDQVVRVVGSDGRVRAYRPPVTAREVTRDHPKEHLVCRADALLIGERIPAVGDAEALQPGQVYFLLPAHLFRSVVSFVSLASSLLLLLSSSPGGEKKNKQPYHQQNGRPFELCRTASGTLRVKFSDDFLLLAAEGKAAEEEKPVLRGDQRLEKAYADLVGYGKSRRWAPKLEPIQEVVVVTSTTEEASSSPAASSERRKTRGFPFLGRLGSRRRRDSSSLSCNGGGAVACSG